MSKQPKGDRHVGRRENIWFPMDEHKVMLAAMAELHETNKSTFIRTAVANFIEMLNDENKNNTTKKGK